MNAGHRISAILALTVPSHSAGTSSTREAGRVTANEEAALPPPLKLRRTTGTVRQSGPSGQRCLAGSRRDPALAEVVRSAFFTAPARDVCTEESLAPLLRQDPRPVLPRRVVAHVLLMAAGQLGDPVPLVVLVESSDRRRGHTP